MTANNNKHTITNEMMWMRHLVFFILLHFLSASEVLVAFNISSSHALLYWQLDGLGFLI